MTTQTNTLTETQDYTLVNDSKRRGYVYDTEKMNLVLRSFDHPENISSMMLADRFTDDEITSNYKFQVKQEGTILRVMIDPHADESLPIEDRLLVSTHKNVNIKLNPASWGSRGFYVSFRQFVLPHMKLDELKPEHVYIILLQDTENRLVTKVSNGGIHLATLQLVEDEFIRVPELDIGLPHPQDATFDFVKDLSYWFSESDPMECAGIVALSRDPKVLSTINITTPEYDSLLRIRMNEPHLLKRAVDVEGTDKFLLLCKLFPEYDFTEITDRLARTSQRLWKLYHQRHIDGDVIQLIQPLHIFFMSLVNKHKKTIDLIKKEILKPENMRRYINKFMVNEDVIKSQLQNIPINAAFDIIKAVETNTHLAEPPKVQTLNFELETKKEFRGKLEEEAQSVTGVEKWTREYSKFEQSDSYKEFTGQVGSNEEEKTE